MVKITDIQQQRMNSWLDAVLDNLDDLEQFIEEDLDKEGFKLARAEIIDQFRLIKLMKNVLDGKTELTGYRHKNNEG